MVFVPISKTRNNHYVPRWYQQGFFEPGRNTLAYLDTTPARKTLDDGRIITERALFDAPTSRAFCARDLYSTFFGTSVNDEIERRLFGDIDARGANALRTFAGTDVGAWHRNFLSLFEYLDIQKIRTPKGLDWLKAQYPTLSQNELMLEMQGVRMLHCSIWSEAVREIVSAEDADVKFIVSDHPVSIYNHAVPPNAGSGAHPNDPSIALKGSQTIFPLNRDLCLILTNLEYARDPSTSATEKRTFARNFRTSMVRTDAFIRTRKLTSQEVARVNYVLKTRARRYIGGARKEWLYPEESVTESWGDLGKTFLPPEQEIWRFGGEMYTKFESGDVHYQDAFGRTEKERAFLKKDQPATPPRPGDMCGCGYGRPFKTCCMQKPISLRPTWTERSIRERNLMLMNAIANVLGLAPGKDWTTVRRELTDDRIAEVYDLYEGLWPLETDLLALLPRPDGAARAVYTGLIHPATITEFAIGASLYFGELIVQNPFLHPGTVKKKYSPVEHPRAYRHEFLKSVLFFLTVMPLVERGLVNLIPDPCDFDHHLRSQMMHMAKERYATTPIDPRKEPQAQRLMRQDVERGIISLPEEVLRAQLLKATPGLDEAALDETLSYIEKLKEATRCSIFRTIPWAAARRADSSHS